jgi:hypothetical protein
VKTAFVFLNRRSAGRAPLPVRRIFRHPILYTYRLVGHLHMGVSSFLADCFKQHQNVVGRSKKNTKIKRWLSETRTLDSSL